MMASFFRDSGGGGGGVVDAKRKRHKPRLDRRNAVKNIEYDASSSSSSSSSSPFRTSSSFGLDLETSFRIKGIDGELDLICQTLGFSGPEDFAIPTAVWEAEKSRSSSLISSRLRRNSAEADASLDHFQANNDDNDFKIKKDREERERLSVGPTRTRDAAAALSAGGMKGERPPAVVIVPASRVVLMEPAVDHLSSTRDIIMRSFVPQELKSTIGVGGISSAHEEHGVINEIEVANAAVEELIGEGRSLSLDQECLYESSVTESNIDAGGGGRESVSVVSQNGKFRRSITSWQKGEILGCGSFGTVYEGFTDDGFFFAVKEVSLLDQGSQGKQSILQLEQEISLLSQFEHENIVQYLGTDKDDNKLYIFLELATKGSLAKLYQKYKLRDSQVSAYTRQILNGLKYLHDRNVVHRDVKCANILVDTSGSVKLADFGLAKAAKLNDVKSCRGTALWMAPEVVNSKNHGYGLAADIWSLGCTVLEMLTGQHPYSDLEGMQALFRIGRGDPPPVPDSLSTDARDFIFRCLQVNPYDRPTAAQLLDNPFVRRPFQTFMSPASPYLHNWRS